MHPSSLEFSKVRRRCLFRRETPEDYHAAIECAVRSDRESPANDFLTELELGAAHDDPRFKPPAPDSEQIHDYAQILSAIEFLGAYGEPETKDTVKHLRDGVWELRHGTRRLSYWDTDGFGHYSPKVRITDFQQLPAGHTFRYTDYWWYPQMDPVLRLGCGWHKNEDLAPPEKIDEAVTTREEDARYDRS